MEMHELIVAKVLYSKTSLEKSERLNENEEKITELVQYLIKVKNTGINKEFLGEKNFNGSRHRKCLGDNNK